MKIEEILDKIRSESQNVFCENLIGIYIHGSYAFGCFSSERSDIDFIVVVKRSLSQAEKENYIKKLLAINDCAPQKGLEMSVVLANYAKNCIYPTPYELHYSNTHKKNYLKNLREYSKNMHGIDRDLCAHFTVIKYTGITLFGQPIDEIFGAVSRSDYIDSVMYDLDSAENDITENPVYVTLNLCRTIAYMTDGKIRSKKQGGEDCISLLLVPEEYRSIVKGALAYYTSGEPFPKTEPENLVKFAQHMLKEIKLRI